MHILQEPGHLLLKSQVPILALLIKVAVFHKSDQIGEQLTGLSALAGDEIQGS